MQIRLNIGNSGPWPICSEQRFVRDLAHPGTILQQRLGWISADVEKYIWMTAQQKESGIHPQRPASVCQNDFQRGEVDRHVVTENRIAVAFTRPVEDRS